MSRKKDKVVYFLLYPQVMQFEEIKERGEGRIQRGMDAMMQFVANHLFQKGKTLKLEMCKIA